ncbi:unnamed protein product [Ilex paraguariensis]|uniref:Cytochrome P450 n=1 Tax=Ilex paraguariensis TaxID=185542 RepID=A0ABC8RXY5_9AQUA
MSKAIYARLTGSGFSTFVLCFAFAMNLFLSSLLFLGVLSSFIFLIFIFHNRRPNSLNLPPGKKGWPVLGEAVEFVSLGRKGNPEKFIDDRKKKYSSELFKTSLAGENMVVFCGASANKFLFSNENKLVVSWWPPTIEKITISSKNTTNTIGETKQMRRYLPEFLKPEALQRYVEVMDCMARYQLEAEWIPNTQVKVLPLSKKYTFAVACKLFMNVEDSEQVTRFAHPFTSVMAGLLSVPINFPGTAFNRGIRAANRIREELLPIIRQRRSLLSEKKEMATGDLLSHMLLATDEDGKFMSEMEIADKILGLLLASHDTTSTVITFVIYYLADHPRVYAQVLEEQMEIRKSKGPEKMLNWDDIQKMKYSRNVVNEVLRLAPPSQGAFKEVISDFTFAGFTIPKGWKVHWSVYSTHKDPKYFLNPEKFDPSRFEGSGPLPFTFVPFGGGPRMCPGSEFARLEILIFIHNLVTKFKWKKIIPDEKVIFDPAPIPVNDLPIRLASL